MQGREVVAYLRVSTQLQGLDGFGIAAQRDAVGRSVRQRIRMYDRRRICGRRDWPQDHLRNRPQLLKAVLVIARLDRLARSVLVTSQLLESNVEFVACDNPHANRLTIQIIAAMAEHEGRLISERTKAGLAAAKARGVKLGRNNLTPDARRRGVIAAVASRKATTKLAYDDLLPAMAALRLSGKSVVQIADLPNAEGQRNQHGRFMDADRVSSTR